MQPGSPQQTPPHSPPLHRGGTSTTSHSRNSSGSFSSDLPTASGTAAHQPTTEDHHHHHHATQPTTKLFSCSTPQGLDEFWPLAKDAVCVKIYYSGTLDDTATSKLSAILNGAHCWLRLELSSTQQLGPRGGNEARTILERLLGTTSEALTELEVSFQAGVDSECALYLAALLPKLPNIRSLDLRDCSIGDEGAAALVARLIRFFCLL